MQPTTKIFANGLMFKRPRENAPEFVKGSLSIKIDEFITFLKQHEKKGWVNLDLKESKGLKLYFELNTWEKSLDKIEQEELARVDSKSDIPF